MVKKSEWLLCMSTANSSKIMVRLPLNLNVHMKEVLGLSSFPSCVSWMSHALQEPLFLCVSKNCFVHSSLMRKQMCWIHWGVRDWQKGRGRDLSIHAWCESIAFPWKQQSFLLLQINTLPPICLLHCWLYPCWLNAAFMMWVFLWRVWPHRGWVLSGDTPGRNECSRVVAHRRVSLHGWLWSVRAFLSASAGLWCLLWEWPFSLWSVA